MSKIFPSIIPDSEAQDDLTAEYVVNEIFDDDYPLLRKAIAIAGDQYDYELDVTGRSTKFEMSSWLAENMTHEGIETLKQAALEATNESD